MNNSKLFSTQLVNEYAAAGYFGEAPDTSEEEQLEIRRVWLENMAKRGWKVNERNIITDNHLVYMNFTDVYDAACDKALEETIEFLAGAF